MLSHNTLLWKRKLNGVMSHKFMKVIARKEQYVGIIGVKSKIW